MDTDLGPRTLDGTDLSVGRIVFGAMTFGSQVEEPEAHEMVATAREAGVTMFDTSNNYNGGLSEEILGRAIKPYRDEVQLTTKVGSFVDQEDQELKGLSKKAIIRSLEGSLRRLGTDHVDVYYFHRPDYENPIDESLEAMDELVRAGKVRYVAQSNFAAWQIAEALGLAKLHGWPELRIAQQQYNLISRRVEDEYESATERLGLSTIVYNPLAGGLLTGKHRFEDVPESDSRFTKSIYRDRYWNRDVFDAIEELKGVAADAGMSLIELSFRWLLARPMTTCLLLGASRKEQLEENLAAVDGPLPDQETMDRCDEVWGKLRGSAPRYNR
jgi:aryl-alcohol dehydrogenase-like predicted oxidoreductase